VTFDLNARLVRIERAAFQESGLTAVRIPASVEVIGELCFARCPLLVLVTFDRHAKLCRIEDHAFNGTGLTSIRIPVSVQYISDSCFSACKFLAADCIQRA
jgi:hypothetical protein